MVKSLLKKLVKALAKIFIIVLFITSILIYNDFLGELSKLIIICTKPEDIAEIVLKLESKPDIDAQQNVTLNYVVGGVVVSVLVGSFYFVGFGNPIIVPAIYYGIPASIEAFKVLFIGYATFVEEHEEEVVVATIAISALAFVLFIFTNGKNIEGLLGQLGVLNQRRRVMVRMRAWDQPYIVSTDSMDGSELMNYLNIFIN